MRWAEAPLEQSQMGSSIRTVTTIRPWSSRLPSTSAFSYSHAMASGRDDSTASRTVRRALISNCSMPRRSSSRPAPVFADTGNAYRPLGLPSGLAIKGRMEHRRGLGSAGSNKPLGPKFLWRTGTTARRGAARISVRDRVHATSRVSSMRMFCRRKTGTTQLRGC